VYGKEAILPTNIFFPSLQLSQFVEETSFPVMKQRLNTLLKMEKEREK